VTARDTWFLLRGLSREAGHWGGFVPALRAALPEADVFTIDLPGAGTRRLVDFPASVREAMELVRADAEVLMPRARRGRTFVFAVSLGGMIALEWAACYPSDLAGAALGNTSAGGVSPPWQRMRAAMWPRVLAAALAAEPLARERGIVEMVVNTTARHDEVARAWAELHRVRPMQPANVLRQIRAASRWVAPARAPGPALLFLAGARDRLVDPRCSRRLAARYGAPVVEHAEAGHDLTTDAEAWVVAELAGWARSVDTPRR
jgi:alpha-beta hydrolase superfamily lysophospholipase